MSGINEYSTLVQIFDVLILNYPLVVVFDAASLGPHLLGLEIIIWRTCRFTICERACNSDHL